MAIKIWAAFLSLCMVNAVEAQKTNKVWLDDINIKSFSEGIPAVVAKTNQAGSWMKIGGIHYEKGVGTQSLSVLSFYLDGNAIEFSAEAGIDDITNSGGTATFYVIGDRKILFESGSMKAGNATKKINVNLRGVKRLGLLIKPDKETSKVYSDWANAYFVMNGDHKPEAIPNTGEKYILTPAPASTPKINSPKIFGATPGNPFLFSIAATGKRPIYFDADHLPEGLSIDHSTGIITGKVDQRGAYLVT
jgi:alpha-galactosidase